MHSNPNQYINIYFFLIIFILLIYRFFEKNTQFYSLIRLYTAIQLLFRIYYEFIMSDVCCV